MKHLIIVTVLAFTGLQLNAQKEEFTAAMQEITDSLHQAKFGTDWQPYANQLERIAEAEPKEWLPRYWAAFCYLNLTYTEPNADKRDLILNKAERFLLAADSLSTNNDELEVMRANIASARIGVDPMNRWQKYGALATAAIEKAKKLNDKNPRIYLHEAQGVFFTPEAYGGGKQKALPLIKIAIQHFDAFKPTSGIMPNWGKNVADYMLTEAEKG
jgi:hypothetical protein